MRVIIPKSLRATILQEHHQIEDLSQKLLMVAKIEPRD